MSTRVLQPIQAPAPGALHSRCATSPTAAAGSKAVRMTLEAGQEAKRPRMELDQIQNTAKGTSQDVGGNAAAGGMQRGAPSNFENFHAKLRQQRGTPSFEPTFPDGVKAEQTVAGTGAVEKQIYHNILRTLGDVRAFSRGPSATLDATLPMTGSLPGIQIHSELTAPHMPYDWALKRSVRFTSSVPFSSCEAALRLDPRTVAQAQTAFLGNGAAGTLSGRPPSASGLPPEARLHAATLSWRCPEQSWDAASVQALAAAAQASTIGASAAAMLLPGVSTSLQPPAPAAGPSTVLAQRLSSWRAGLRSVYVQMRCGRCPAFYLITQSSKPLAILFCAGGVRGGSQAPHAVISQSTRVMRSRLSAAGVAFLMPLAPTQQDEKAVQQAALLRQVDPEAADLDVDPDDASLLPSQANGTAGANRWTSVRDLSPESAVLVSGPQAVHGLLDLLLNEVRFQDQQLLGAGRDTADLPALLAPTPFEGAGLHRPALRLRQVDSAATAGGFGTGGGGAGGRPPLPRQVGAAIGSRAPAEGGEPCGVGQGPQVGGPGVSAGGSSVEVAGPVPPWVLHRMWHVLQDSQQGSLQAQVEQDPMCLSMNVELSAAGVAGAEHEPSQQQRWRDAAWATESEVQALCSRNAALHRRVVKVATCLPSGSLQLKLS